MRQCMHVAVSACIRYGAYMWGKYYIDPRTSVQSTKVPREPILITEKWRWKIFFRATRLSTAGRIAVTNCGPGITQVLATPLLSGVESNCKHHSWVVILAQFGSLKVFVNIIPEWSPAELTQFQNWLWQQFILVQSKLTDVHGFL